MIINDNDELEYIKILKDQILLLHVCNKCKYFKFMQEGKYINTISNNITTHLWEKE